MSDLALLDALPPSSQGDSDGNDLPIDHYSGPRPMAGIVRRQQPLPIKVAGLMMQQDAQLSPIDNLEKVVRTIKWNGDTIRSFGGIEGDG